MVKSLITLIISIILLVSLSITEQSIVNNSFDDLKVKLVEVYKKTENQTAVKDDILSAQELWLENKKHLHIFIPHNEIKEIELWIAESTTLVENKKYDDALSKIDVVIELIEQIPKTFSLRIENIL